MVPPPPWHFSGNALWITYTVAPDVAASFLPPRLELGQDAGAAAIGFFDWQWCTDAGTELREPGRGQFKECLIALSCTVDGRPVVRVPYAWVDSVVPLVRGLIQGMPKVDGSVWMTRSFPVGRAGVQHRPGAEFTGTLSSLGRRIATASVVLSGTDDNPPPLSDLPMVHSRHFPAWHPGEDPINELVCAKTTNIEFGSIWSGEATIQFEDVRDPNLSLLSPTEVGRGYLFSYAETLEPGSRI